MEYVQKSGPKLDIVHPLVLKPQYDELLEYAICFDDLVNEGVDSFAEYNPVAIFCDNTLWPRIWVLLLERLVLESMELPNVSRRLTIL